MTRWRADQAAIIVLPPALALGTVVIAGVVFVMVMAYGLRALGRA
jgi:hypothetical protein